jgi:hypothetical protein
VRTFTKPNLKDETAIQLNPSKKSMVVRNGYSQLFGDALLDLHPLKQRDVIVIIAEEGAWFLASAQVDLNRFMRRLASAI